MCDISQAKLYTNMTLFCYKIISCFFAVLLILSFYFYTFCACRETFNSINFKYQFSISVTARGLSFEPLECAEYQILELAVSFYGCALLAIKS